MYSPFKSMSRRRRTILRVPLRRGYSMLEVVLAASICLTAIVPALAMLRDGIALGDIIDTRHLLLTYSVSKMEEQLAIIDRKSTRLNSSHVSISYAVFC